MSRTPIISGNWKMHHNHFEAIQTVQKLSYLLPKEVFDTVEVSVHPPFTDLRSVQTTIETDRMGLGLGAQHCHWEDKGAFTGEVSAPMLAKLNADYVIVGHSERRELFGETDADVRRKLEAVQANAMTPIVCVGETLEERESGATDSKITGQVEAALDGLPTEQVAGLVIAYEPIWAIGTGATATPADAQETISIIRSALSEQLSEEVAGGIRILYGGSVKAGNAAALTSQPDIDGALVGGASLDAAEFAAIVKATKS